MDSLTRQRCKAACEKLEEAIAELDSCGFEVYANHAHRCLAELQLILSEDCQRKMIGSPFLQD